MDPQLPLVHLRRLATQHVHAGGGFEVAQVQLDVAATLRYDQVSFRNNLRLDSQIVRCEVGPESETNPMPQASLFF